MGVPVIMLDNGKTSSEMIIDGFNGFKCDEASIPSAIAEIKKLNRNDIYRDSLMKYGPRKSLDIWNNYLLSL